MTGCLVLTRRAAAGIGLLLVLLGALPIAAFADATARGYQPAPNHMSVVVTTNQVYVTWTDPPGVQPTRVYRVPRRRLRVPDRLDRRDADRRPFGDEPPDRRHGQGRQRVLLHHLRLRSDGYAGEGRKHRIRARARPERAASGGRPEHVAGPACKLELERRLNATQKKAIVGSAGGLLAVALLFVIVRLLRRSRTEETGLPVWGTELRLSFTGLSASALIIPAVIALAWVLVVTALVVFR